MLSWCGWWNCTTFRVYDKAPSRSVPGENQPRQHTEHLPQFLETHARETSVEKEGRCVERQVKTRIQLGQLENSSKMVYNGWMCLFSYAAGKPDTRQHIRDCRHQPPRLALTPVAKKEEKNPKAPTMNMNSPHIRDGISDVNAANHYRASLPVSRPARTPPVNLKIQVPTAFVTTSTLDGQSPSGQKPRPFLSPDVSPLPSPRKRPRIEEADPRPNSACRVLFPAHTATMSSPPAPRVILSAGSDQSDKMFEGGNL